MMPTWYKLRLEGTGFRLVSNVSHTSDCPWSNAHLYVINPDDYDSISKTQGVFFCRSRLDSSMAKTNTRGGGSLIQVLINGG